MSPQAGRMKRPRTRHAPAVESLEPRALLAVTTQTFQVPDLTDLKLRAHEGHNTGPAAIDRMVQALQDQLTSGPLADLTARRVDAAGFLTEVSGLVSGFKTGADQQLLPQAPNIDNLVKLQATRIVADLTSLNQQRVVGLLTDAQATSGATEAINSLAGGPLRPLDTTVASLAARTVTFEGDLNTLADSLASGAAKPLGLAKVAPTLKAEAEAYRADVLGSLYLHPSAGQAVGDAVTTLETKVAQIAQGSVADPQAPFLDAVAAFEAAIGETFGPNSLASRRGPSW